MADSVRGMGLGTILLGHLAAAAASAGITTFTAQVMPDNHRMLTVFRESGFTVSVRSSSGVMEVMLPTLGNGRLGRWQGPLAGPWRT
jgi:acetate---CoA ligase (ADP-forming)